MKKPLRVGFDFDGVIAYNPARVAHLPIVYIKKKLGKNHKMKFFYPTSPWQQIFWKMLHSTSIFPSKGMELLRELVRTNQIEAHIITGRYSFLDQDLQKWLRRFNLTDIFKTINVNKRDEQPHLFKERMIKQLDLKIFIEDNWDIVKYLDSKNVAQIHWIFNILERNYDYAHKFPYVEKSLLKMVEQLEKNKTDSNPKSRKKIR